MRTPARILLLVLALTAATSVFYAVQQQTSLRQARAAAESLEQERSELRKKLWDAERRRKELEARLRAIGSTEGTTTIQTETPDFSVPGPDESRGGPPGRRDGFNRLMAALDTPEAQRLLGLVQRGQVDANYSALFRALNLSPAQIEQFRNLLAEKQAAVGDVLAAARSQGLTGRESRDEIRALMQATQQEIDSSIRALLGENAYQEYQNYERTGPQRAVVSQFNNVLPTMQQLSPQQASALVDVLAANAPAQANRSGVVALAGRIGSINLSLSSAPITDAAIQQASSFLTAEQVSSLKAYQEQQQAQAQLSQLMRTQNQPRRAGGQSGGASGAANASSTTPPKG
ncbi:MAG: hypothetical protein NDI75_12110 [Candidatus Didemnitutus sp.]|nr:hypothetical protein [Candidatus Didemnitutus sp.]